MSEKLKYWIEDNILDGSDFICTIWDFSTEEEIYKGEFMEIPDEILNYTFCSIEINGLQFGREEAHIIFNVESEQ